MQCRQLRCRFLEKITPPGDADNVLTVGAIDKRAVLATFSSVGNTADHRVKPDVVAVGVGSDVIRTDGNQGRANGTSFLHLSCAVW